MKKATYEDFLNMKVGQPLVVNLKDSICDIAIFLGYNKEKGCAIVSDCLMHTKGVYTTNVAEYPEAFIFPTDKEELLKIFKKV
jgi:hypothetical protein